MAKFIRKGNKKKTECEQAAADFLALAAYCESAVVHMREQALAFAKDETVRQAAQAMEICAQKVGGETFYDCYAAFMQHYENFALFYNPQREWLKSGEIRGILEGIAGIVHARKTAMRTGVNPIWDEKERLVKTHLEQLKTSLATIEKDLMAKAWHGATQQLAIPLLARFDKATAEEIADRIAGMALMACEAGFADVYADSVRDCTVRMKDVRDNGSAATYRSMVDAELEVLSAIVNVQVAALEKLMAGTRENGHPENTVVVTCVLKILEMYRSLSKITRETAVLFELKEWPHPAADAAGGFKIDIQHLREKHFLDKIFEQQQAGYAKLMAVYRRRLLQWAALQIERRTGSHLFQKERYHLQKMIAENKMMAKEMIKALGNIAAWRHVNAPAISESAFPDILIGICETIDIKIENLAESAERFVSTSIAMLESGKTDTVLLTEAEKRDLAEKCVDDVFARMTAAYGEGRDDCPIGLQMKEIAENCTDNAYAHAAMARVSKALENRRNDVIKQAASFKRDGLLYEMSTFEEILRYSVSRLRTSDKLVDSSFVSAIDAVDKDLAAILSKNDITLILPAPHDLFNAKEHEILLAEESADFQKGEVVKVMNSGYRQGDAVLLRANIIAAR